MKRLRSAKACAALVLIAWLASIVSLWGFGAAANQAIQEREPKNCSVKDLQDKSVRMELAGDAGEVVEILNGDKEKADCIRRGKTAEVGYADSFFLAAYSVLTLALFLFAGALRKSPGLFRALLGLGILLAAAMAIGDLVENRHLVEMMELAGKAVPPLDRIGALLPGLKTAASVKMGAVALATLLLAALWPSRPRWTWLLKLFGLLSTALFAGAILLDQRREHLEWRCWEVLDWEIASAGMAAFAAFALAAVIHAVTTMADRQTYQGDPKS